MKRKLYFIPGIFMLVFGLLWMVMNSGDSFLKPEMLTSLFIIIVGGAYISIGIKGEPNSLVSYSIMSQFLSIAIFIIGIVLSMFIPISSYATISIPVLFGIISFPFIIAGGISFLLGLCFGKREIGKSTSLIAVVVIQVIVLVVGYIIFRLS